MKRINDKLVSWADMIDAGTIAQAEKTSRAPHVVSVALMADAHVGKGSTVGSVIATQSAVIPAATGVDLGCGMIAVHTSIKASQLPDNLNALHHQITRSIPSGVGQGHARITDRVKEWLVKHPLPTERTYKWFGDAESQLGSMGSGNHFLEVCIDENQDIWIVLHSGSRGIGNKLASYHIDIARGLEANLTNRLEDPDLAAFYEGTPEFRSYIADMLWAQEYALENREIMMDLALRDLFRYGAPGVEISRINCHHNYCTKETHMGLDLWITRKGAIRAGKGDFGVIPGSMATGSFIVEGLGNPDSFNSSSHGAGRKMSRGEARRTLTTETLNQYMQGKAWNSTQALDLLDEHPDAYKDIHSVMESQKDLVRIVNRLETILNYKAADSRGHKH